MSSTIRDLSVDRTASYGRGGAGNMAPRSPAMKPVDLETPTIKQHTYTTGRGGTGNMAANDPTNPELARVAQDLDITAHAHPALVAAAAAREPENAIQYGRGGAGNVHSLSAGEREAARSRNAKRKSDAQGVVGGFGREQAREKEVRKAEKEAREKEVRKAEKEARRGQSKERRSVVEKGFDAIKNAVIGKAEK